MVQEYRKAEKETEGIFIGILGFMIIFALVFLSTFGAIAFLGGLQINVFGVNLQILESFFGGLQYKVPVQDLQILKPFLGQLPDPLVRWFETIAIFCWIVSGICGFIAGLESYKFWIGQEKD